MANQLPYLTPDLPKDFGRFRWLGIFAGFVGLILASAATTQFIAMRFFYSPALGVPVAQYGKLPIYKPWEWAGWLLRYSSSRVPYVHQTITTSLCILVTLTAVVVFAVLYSNFRRSGKLMAGGEHIHGSARFATKEDLERTGILTLKKGVYIGAFRDGKYDHYLRHNGPEHILAFAPTRSGKGVGIVIPSLLGWDQSTIVYDLKGENWALTSGFRSKPVDKGGLGQTCLKFAPLEDDTAHFNPFTLIRFGTDREVADTQNIAAMLLDTGDNPSDRYFLDEAVSLASGLVLHLLYEAGQNGYRTPSPANLLEIATDPEGPQSVLAKIQRFEHRSLSDPPFPGIDDLTSITHPVIAGKMAKMLAKGDKEFGSVLGSLTRPLELYADPRIRRATAYSDFQVADLVNHPTSLFIVIPPSDKLRLKPLVRTMLSLTINRLTERMDFEEGKRKDNPYRLLYLIDEFPQLGNMQEFADALSYMAGYGCKALLITQDIEQLKDPRAYGDHETITANCHVRIAYAPNTQRTAELLSSMTGKTTIQQQTINISGSRTSSGQNHMSTSLNFVARDLLTPSEVSTLRKPSKVDPGTDKERIVGPGQALVFFAGEPPILGVQILYFLNPTMLAKTKIPHPPSSHLTDTFPKAASAAALKPARPHTSAAAMFPTRKPNVGGAQQQSLEITPQVTLVETTIIEEPADSHLLDIVPQFPRPTPSGRFTRALESFNGPLTALSIEETEPAYAASIEDTDIA